MGNIYIDKLKFATSRRTVFSGLIENNPQVYSNLKILTRLGVNDNKKIEDYGLISKKWVNNKDQLSIAQYTKKFSKHSIYFPGVRNQKLMAKGSIFNTANSSFTISALIKIFGETDFNNNIFLEIIPLSFFTDINDIVNKETRETFLNNYKNSSLSIRLIDTKAFVGDWTHIFIIYKNNKLYFYIDGKLVNIKNTINLFNVFNTIGNDNLVSIIGGSCLNDISETDPYTFYLDNLIVYNNAFFDPDKIKSFPVYNNRLLQISDIMYINKDKIYRNIRRPGKIVEPILINTKNKSDTDYEKILYNKTIKFTAIRNVEPEEEAIIIEF